MAPGRSKRLCKGSSEAARGECEEGVGWPIWGRGRQEGMRLEGAGWGQSTRSLMNAGGALSESTGAGGGCCRRGQSQQEMGGDKGFGAAGRVECTEPTQTWRQGGGLVGRGQRRSERDLEGSLSIRPVSASQESSFGCNWASHIPTWDPPWPHRHCGPFCVTLAWL